ncbi:MerR family transcriptional regulator [Ornithinimicrobium flavum]|uniref:MerR family transcriptional regulator n=1 Tax=Ornithinimicrobium flavum TaxID=1288636 RepID=UPI001EE7E1F3|nr:MerR family transcriptional regulator [Ornithinimicrobium flavum]
MRIGELAAATGVSTKTIRFYETAGVLPAPARTTSGYRQYDASAADRLAFIRAAQTAGLTLAHIRDVISARDISEAPCHHVATLLADHAAALQARLAQLSELLSSMCAGSAIGRPRWIPASASPSMSATPSRPAN